MGRIVMDRRGRVLWNWMAGFHGVQHRTPFVGDSPPAVQALDQSL
jgi:hypothetical protein